MGKHLTTHYYGQDIAYSYWQGCSTGGRQAMVLAQRFPTLYNGILSVAPAINWVTFLVTEFFPQVAMQKQAYFPPACELNAITGAAIEECDALDGVQDGVIAASGLCRFDPHSVVGKKFDCDGVERKITQEAAEIAKVAWSGPVRDGESIWFGRSLFSFFLFLPTASWSRHHLPLFVSAKACHSNNATAKGPPMILLFRELTPFSGASLAPPVTRTTETARVDLSPSAPIGSRRGCSKTSTTISVASTNRNSTISFASLANNTTPS